MIRSLLALILLLVFISRAEAVVSVVQENVQVPTTGTLVPYDFANDGTNTWWLNQLWDGTTLVTVDATTKGLKVYCVNCVASGTLTQVNGTGGSGVGTSSTTIMTSSTVTSVLKVCVPVNAANGIWVNWAGGTATAAAPNEYMPPGQCDSWSLIGGFLPTNAITAIATATTNIGVYYK